MAAYICHKFHHHHAQSDAEAAGRVLLAMMKELDASTPKELFKKISIVSGFPACKIVLMESAILSPRVLELLNFTEVHQRHAEVLARATGEHFNIFKILRIDHYEVRTHSPVFGGLLDPKGSHGQEGEHFCGFSSQGS